MPGNSMDRKHSKRELERAVGSIAWTIQHLEVVIQAFLSSAMYYAETNQDVPDSYEETINALTEINAALLMIATNIKKVDETI